MNRRRTVITGLGVITPIGTGIEAFEAGLRAGKSSVRKVSRFDVSIYRTQIAAEVRDFLPEDFFTGRQLRRLDRYGQFSVAATQLAVRDSGLDISREDRDNVGVSIGSALGGVGMAEDQYGVFLRDGLRAVSLTLALAVYGGAANCNIAIDLGVNGPNFSNANSCASGSVAIGEAMRAIRDGRADIMLAGGSECPLYPLTYGAFDIIKSMSVCNDQPESACRPFDAKRDGFVMGEGAAVMVLEEAEHAMDRGAHIYGEIVGYACTNDAYHMTAPLPDGSQAARAMTLAMADAHIRPAEVEYINAHGSSTVLNDKAETAAIKSVFGEAAYRIPISATKSMHAHSLGAAGAIEACACALALDRGFIPPTVNLSNPDSECDLDYVPHFARQQELNCVVSNSFGFGDINASLVFRKDLGSDYQQNSLYVGDMT